MYGNGPIPHDAFKSEKLREDRSARSQQHNPYQRTRAI
jgi:hypothetical protein